MLGLYPFTDGREEDFQKAFARLIGESCGDTAALYDPERYAAPFFPVGGDLVRQAKEAEAASDADKAWECFLRAGAVYRSALFPVTCSLWARRPCREAYLDAAPYLSSPDVAEPYLVQVQD